MKDQYIITILFNTMKLFNNKKIISAISHSIIEPSLLSIVGSDRRRYLIPLSAIAFIEFNEQLDNILSKKVKQNGLS